MVFLCKNGRRSDDIWEKVKEGGGKKSDLGNPKRRNYKWREQHRFIDAETGWAHPPLFIMCRRAYHIRGGLSLRAKASSIRMILKT